MARTEGINATFAYVFDRGGLDGDGRDGVDLFCEDLSREGERKWAKALLTPEQALDFAQKLSHCLTPKNRINLAAYLLNEARKVE